MKKYVICELWDILCNCEMLNDRSLGIFLFWHWTMFILAFFSAVTCQNRDDIEMFNL